MMNRNLILVVVGALGIGAGVLGYWFYQEQHRPGVDISIGGHGVSIRER
jgi:hypothetical protein